MRTIKIIRAITFSISLLVIPFLLQAQYTGGNGRGDASISLTNVHISVQKIEEAIPANYELYQNYPNPFNPSTSIRFTIVKNCFVTLKIFDMLGRNIAVLVNEKLSAGTYEVPFSFDQNLHQPASGVYFYSIDAGDFKDIRKMVFIK